MKINYLKLSNIGPYVGEHIFNLNTNSSKNIILIGGKNGAGKTTFLKAIRYGLFGSFAMGLKTDTDKYFEEIRSLINNKMKSDFYVEISFDYIENFETKEYVLIRKWKYSKKHIIEEISIKCAGILLDSYETKEISDKIRAMTSPQLINSFIFDGEKISTIIEEGNISNYLEDTFNSIFSIDLIKQTKHDLENYLEKKANDNKAKDQIDNVRLISQIHYFKNLIKQLETTYQSYNANLQSLISLKKANTENFYKLGGMTKKIQEKYTLQLDKFNKEKGEMSIKIKNYVETDLPIYICRDILTDAFMQSKLEQQSKYPDYLAEIEKFLGKDLTELKAELNDMVCECVLIHDLTKKESEYLHERLQESFETTSNIRPYLNNKFSKTDEYKILKKALSNNDNIDVINDLFAENKRIDISITTLKSDMTNLKLQLEDAQEELQMTYNLYQKSLDVLKKSSLVDSSFILGQSVLELCDKFAKIISRSKLKQISDQALKIFNETIRKNDFITKLTINSEFNLVLVNSNGTHVDPKTLSAGEMQILVSSLIWAMFRVSGRREMFIFDTPLARLDNENRYNFISKIISTISSQVVILSTDSEFVGNNLKAIEDNIYSKYLLEYNVNDNSTSVSNDYFGG